MAAHKTANVVDDSVNSGVAKTELSESARSQKRYSLKSGKGLNVC